MVAPTPDEQQQLTRLADYLFARREALLSNYWTVCRQDPALRVAGTLTREEFFDNIPFCLTLFEQQLRQEPPAGDINQIAREHGLHRWHKGYTLRELLQEVSHLQVCVADELHTYCTLTPDLTATVLAYTSRELGRFINEIIQASAVEYDEFERLEASERAESLQQALEQVNSLVRERGEFLRMTSHDLRGSFSVLHGAASLLNRPETREAERTEMMQILNRSLTGIRSMLLQLTDLARLEAGQEQIDAQPFDAADLLRKVVESTRPMAEARRLQLLADGPQSLHAVSDPVKVQRIVQNLLYNALKYTRNGFVSLSWAQEDNTRWVISVQDTGPGLPAGPSALFADKLKPMDEKSANFQRDRDPAATAHVSTPDQAPPSQVLSEGEGVGLHVVKRLCELLGATMNVETLAGRGTIFRIRFPLNQEPSTQP